MLTCRQRGNVHKTLGDGHWSGSCLSHSHVSSFRVFTISCDKLGAEAQKWKPSSLITPKQPETSEGPSPTQNLSYQSHPYKKKIIAPLFRAVTRILYIRN